jgi:hypothetical protein
MIPAYSSLSRRSLKNPVDMPEAEAYKARRGRANRPTVAMSTPLFDIVNHARLGAIMHAGFAAWME